MYKVLFTELSLDELSTAISEKLLAKLSKQVFSTSFKEENKEFLSANEVAEMCKVKSLSTLWQWRKQGLLIPEARAGRKPLYKYDDVVNFLNNKR